MGGQVSRLTTEIVAQNLAKPRNSIVGHIVGKMIKKRNANVEITAARLCNIQPDSQVLEVGFGPGVGLKAAYEYVKAGSGIVHGVDISDKMLRDASKDLKKEISAGKVILHPNSVTDLPFENDTFDSIFHVNCYYFWPDLDAASKELYRVIKPDGVIVAVKNPKTCQQVMDKGFLKYGNTDPKRYMGSLEQSGFIDVKLGSERSDEADVMLETVIGKAGKKDTQSN